MLQLAPPKPINTVIALLDVNASVLGRVSGVDHSLISKWQQGNRPLTRRSKQLRRVAAALIELDHDGRLVELLAPYCQQGEDKLDALCNYLTSEPLPALVPRATLPERQYSGSYVVNYVAYLGLNGFRNAARHMLDYLQMLPPEREVRVLCSGAYEWLTNRDDFIKQFIESLFKAFERGATVHMIKPHGYSLFASQAFGGVWLAAHLRGQIVSHYYDGALMDGLRVIVSIPGFSSLRAEADAMVEDQLYVAIHSDARDIRNDEELCEYYLQQSQVTACYNFLRHPHVDCNAHLPVWSENRLPDGSFYALCRLPSFAVITRQEYAAICGNDSSEIPEYMFAAREAFAPGRHRIMLCREDICEALGKQRRAHEVLSQVLGRRAYVTHKSLVAQLKRLMNAMERNDNFEVALLPRVAFAKLEVEVVCWSDSVSLAWLQDMSQSVLINEQHSSAALHDHLDYVWDKLLSGWKRQDKVLRQLRKWVNGKDLHNCAEDSAIVQNWQPVPRD